jgi:hypothetical protein
MPAQASEPRSSIVVGDLVIETEICFKRIDELRYYKENPRIFSILKQLGNAVTQTEIERNLWAQESTKDLFHDIKRNGGLIEEVIVRENEVLEGNSRLCAYRHLYRNAEEDGDTEGMRKWETIRAKVLDPGTEDRTVFAILGMLHIRGKAEWRPYEQASYLYRQSTTYKMRPSELAEQIGHKESEIANMIEAYKLMDKHEITDPARFSYFVEFAKSRKLDKDEIAQYLPPNFDLAKNFSDWVKNDKIPRAEAVRDLPIILKDQSARKKFLGDHATFDDALEIAKDRHPETTNAFYSKLKRATEALNDAEELQVKKEIAEDAQKKHIVRELYRTVKKFARGVGIDVGTN